MGLKKAKYGNNEVVVKGIIPAFFQVGKFPAGIDDINVEGDFDKGIVNHDTVLIEIDGSLIRVHPSALEEIEVKVKTKSKKGKDK